jgi:hypothetical protein
MDLAYPEAVKARLKRVARAVESGGYCSSPSELTAELDLLSVEILERVARSVLP